MAVQQRPAEWGAIRVPRVLGLTVMDILGARCGAVIEHERDLYWLVGPSAAADWDVDNTRVVDPGLLMIPPSRRTQGPGPHWRMCPGDSDWLTDTAALRAAVEDALGPQRKEGQP
ncbi:hypothetical protein [Streptomyces sp. NPDC102264]|uniref:hypothetical protein n=1 Tax=Streptomyces sp. NPDC102264 TaxID=3366149 RepID=UPI0038085A03